MKILTQDDAFDFVLSLMKKLEHQGHIEAAKFLTFYLSGAAASTGSERISLTIGGLREFLVKFGNLIDDIERQKVKQSIEAYINANKV